MSIKLCLLKNSETAICDLREMIDPEGNESVGYFMSDPFKVTQVGVGRVEVSSQDDEPLETGECRVEFHRLFPLSNDRGFNVSHEFIDVVYEPHPELVESYLGILKKFIDEHKTNEVSLDGSFLVDSNELSEEDSQKFQNQYLPDGGAKV